MTQMLKLDPGTLPGPVERGGPADRRRLGPPAVMICDDHAMFAGGLADALTRDGTTVLATTQDVDQVTGLVGALQPDVCLLGAPQFDDTLRDVVVALHRTSPGTRVLVVVATTSNQLWGAWDSREVDVIVSKQCRLADIAAAIDRARVGERAIIGLERPQPQIVCGPGWVLTDREREVLRLMVSGATTREMSSSMGISVNTVRTHVQHLLDKLGVRTRVQAARVAVLRGAITV